MFFTYIYRELRRRHRQALLTALGLAVGVGLVVAVTAYAGGVSKAQDEVLHSLYGVGTDVSVTQTAKLDQGQGGPMQFGMNPGDNDKQGQRFSRDQLRGSPGQVAISTKKITDDQRAGRRVGRHRQPGADRDTPGGQVRPGLHAAERREPGLGGLVRRQQRSASALRLTGAHQDLVVQPGRCGCGRHHARSLELERGRLGALVRLLGRQGEGRPGGQGLRQAGEPEGRRHGEGERQEVHDRGHRHRFERHVLVQRLHPPRLGRRDSATTPARSTRSTCGRRAPTRSRWSRRRSSRSCPRRP